MNALGGCYLLGGLGAGKAYLIQELCSFGKGKERVGYRRVENISSLVIDSLRYQATEKDLAVARLLQFPCPLKAVGRPYARGHPEAACGHR